MTLRPIPTNAERDWWGPQGMAHCVWLLTFEHPSDLPLVYEWFGQYWDSVNRLYNSKISRFLLIGVVFHDIMLLNPRPQVGTMPTIIHPFLNSGVEARAYQIRAAKSGLSSSTLMVMPTGFGKTAVEWLVMAEFLKFEHEKIVLIAPTTGLVAQQQRMAREMINLEPEYILRYTGETPPSKRREIWDGGRILMATPQVIRNDAASGKISLKDVSLIIFDEAHHATGNHAYAQVGDLYLNQNQKGYTLAATASPGATKSAILEVAKRLGIDRFDVSIKDEALLKPYAVTLHNDVINLELPNTLKSLIYPLEEHQTREVESIQRMGFMGPVKNITSKIITDAQMAASRAISRRDARGYNAAKKIADIRRMHMLLDLLKTQGLKAALAFLEKAEDEGRSGERVTNRFLAIPVIHNFRISARDLDELHPKSQTVIDMVTEKVSNNPSSRILIFTEYRYTVNNLIESLSGVDGVKVSKFIGQSTSGKQKGMTQKQQLARLEEFRNGEINVLVATSVGEEGLDVPAADLVLMYEPVPSAIRSIQRRGRTARQRSGTVKTLIANNTRDEYVSRAARVRERKMYSNLSDIERQQRLNFRTNMRSNSLDAFSVRLENEDISAEDFLEAEISRLEKLYPKKPLTSEATASKSQKTTTLSAVVDPKDKRPSNQTGLDDFFNEQGGHSVKEKQAAIANVVNGIVDDLHDEINTSVVIDHREASSTLSAYISSLGVNVEYQNLETGDILIHNDIIIERKTARDLLTSIIDQRLFKQCLRMRDSNQQPLLLIELGEIGNSVHPNAVMGALAHITLDLGVPIITTKDSMESAYLIYLIARKMSKFTQAIRDHIEYQPVDDDTIKHLCDVASIEISEMVNQSKNKVDFVSRWSATGRSKQIELLVNITDIDFTVCERLLNKYDSIAGVFKNDLSVLQHDVDAADLERLSKFFSPNHQSKLL